MNALKIRQIGKSLGVVLPKEALSRLNVKEGDQLFLTEAPDGSVRLTPYDPDFEEQMEAASEGMGAYRNALRQLAK
jgi:putative addiction module antidote